MNKSKKSSSNSSAKKTGSAKKAESGNKSGKTAKQEKSSSEQNKTQETPKKVWVEPVYKEEYHPEEGHWETVMVDVQKVKCRCGEVFDSMSEWQAHQDAYVARMRIEKNDPNYTCDGTHGTSHYVTIQEPEDRYVVDHEAYTEKVLVKEGHWE